MLQIYLFIYSLPHTGWNTAIQLLSGASPQMDL